MTRSTIRPLRYRQVHLDFHTSEHVPDIGAKFDAADFVATLQMAHVDSITLFAKCHHGWSYYPTRVGAAHPRLARPDLLGDMVRACAAADIETPLYITVQWDERNARLHPEWRVMRASAPWDQTKRGDSSAQSQLSATWHTLCLNHEGLREEILAQAREVLTLYPTVGVFFDIVMNTDCVCPACLERMQTRGLDPLKPEDRLRNDEEVNESFRRAASAVIRAEFPGVRIFYNAGHVGKAGRDYYESYTHLELESLPTGGWGYNHYACSARYAANLGFDFLGMTGKFHMSWGEFGGFKHPEALEYECALMAALGSKCLVGDQLHPGGGINRDTYRTIEPAYRRIKALEPYLQGARQLSEIAVVSAEYFYRRAATKNRESDDGAVQMLLELGYSFDVIDPEMDFSAYRLLVLPDVIPVNPALADKLKAYLGDGGRLIASWQSGIDPQTGDFAVATGLRRAGQTVPFDPSYVQKTEALDDGRLPASPFVVYDCAETVSEAGAEVLAWVRPAYFNRSYARFCSHQHTPDDPDAPPCGVAVSLHHGVGYLAYPLFRAYRAVGQPLYRTVVDVLIRRLMPDPVLTTDLSSAGRAVVAAQAAQKRLIVHLLYAVPQVRGQAARLNWQLPPQHLEMIEDVQAVGPVTASVRSQQTPQRVYDALTGEEIPWQAVSGGRIEFRVPRLHMHRAIVLEGITAD